MRHLFYKEYLKTKRYYWYLLGLNIIASLMAALNMRSMFLTNDPEAVWNSHMIALHPLNISLQYLPILSACIIATLQMAPEISGRRIRLSLQLPINQMQTLLSIPAFGFIMLFLIYLSSTATMLTFYRVYFPIEYVFVLILTLTPWFLSGFIVYLASLTILSEPKLKNKIIYIIVGIWYISLLVWNNKIGVYSKILPFLIASMFLYIVFYLQTTIRLTKNATS